MWICSKACATEVILSQRSKCRTVSVHWLHRGQLSSNACCRLFKTNATGSCLEATFVMNICLAVFTLVIAFSKNHQKHTWFHYDAWKWSSLCSEWWSKFNPRWLKYPNRWRRSIHLPKNRVQLGSIPFNLSSFSSGSITLFTNLFIFSTDPWSLGVQGRPVTVIIELLYFLRRISISCAVNSVPLSVWKMEG